MGLTSVILGHAYEPVNEAVRRELSKGVNFQRPSRIELEFAEFLNDFFPWLDQFKFAKNGSTATTGAVKLARAYTGKDKVAVCEDHPFFSYDDWYVGTTVMDRGIPDAYKELSVTFPYGELDETRSLFESQGESIACVILEPLKYEHPPENYLINLKSLCEEHNIVMILDEIVTGFKHDSRGVQNLFDVEPHLTTFGKSIANGYSVDVLAGKKKLMSLGGLRHDEERVFLMSTTNGAETTGLAAGLKTLEILEKEDVIAHRKSLGRQVKKGLNSIFETASIDEYVNAKGLDAMPVLDFQHPDDDTAKIHQTYLLQELLKEGLLVQGLLMLSYSHGQEEVDRILDAFESASESFRRARDNDSMTESLEGPVMKPVFRKYN